MNPRKAKTFYKEVAEELGLDEELVRDLMEFYWSELRKNLVNLKYPNIRVPGLGSFRIKEWRLNHLLNEYQTLSNANDGSSFKKMAMKTELEDRISKINSMISEVDKLKEQKKLIRAKRYDKTDLEKQVVNPGGDSQLDIQEESGRESISGEDEDM